jgi:hypothetical protein
VVSAQIADLNGDGRPDLVLQDVEAAGLDGIGLTVLLNAGDGTFGSRHDYRAAGDLGSLAIDDVNGDRRPDLAIADSNLNAISLFLDKGHGRFQRRRDYPTDFLPQDIAIADLNGDGRPDFLATATHTVSVLLDRPGLCNVQDVWGKRTAVAKWMLARVNCRAVIRRVYDPAGRWPKGGLVDSQKPSYGAVLPAGAKVRLTVRSGHRG